MKVILDWVSKQEWFQDDEDKNAIELPQDLAEQFAEAQTKFNVSQHCIDLYVKSLESKVQR